MQYTLKGSFNFVIDVADNWHNFLLNTEKGPMCLFVAPFGLVFSRVNIFFGLILYKSVFVCYTYVWCAKTERNTAYEEQRIKGIY